MSPVPILSVVLGTTHPWPACRECLESLAPQAVETGAEILVGDGGGHGLPDPLPDWLAPVRRVSLPGGSIFDLRARALTEATGAIVAFTEDHCLPAPDWCRRILDAHAANPHAAAVGGAVTNRSTANALDWASFLMTFAPFHPPLNGHAIERTPPPANVSVKRAVLPSKEWRPGELELELVPSLYREKRIVHDGMIVVGHRQSHGALGMLALHFHNGRSTMGLGQAHGRDWGYRARLALEVSLAEMASKPELAALMPRMRRRMTMLSWAHAVGELTAQWFGPGRSPHLLE